MYIKTTHIKALLLSFSILRIWQCKKENRVNDKEKK